jgi:hypothetical protein
MNTNSGRFFCGLLMAACLFFSAAAPVRAASPWTEEKSYGAKTWAKFGFGFKNSFLGWMTPWAEAKNPKYQKEWIGYSAGIGEGLIYTAGGLIQLATFFVPVDFPDMGYGLPIPDPERVKNPPKPYAPHSKK